MLECFSCFQNVTSVEIDEFKTLIAVIRGMYLNLQCDPHLTYDVLNYFFKWKAPFCVDCLKSTSNKHFGNTTLLYKAQPLLDEVNVVCQIWSQLIASSLSIDESMKSYYGHHSIKQFIKGKPIRYSLKL